MNHRKLFFALGIAASLPLAVSAQPKPPPVVIGWLGTGSVKVNGAFLAAFKEGMAALGRKEGTQFVSRSLGGGTRRSIAGACRGNCDKEARDYRRPSFGVGRGGPEGRTGNSGCSLFRRSFGSRTCY